MDVLCALNVGCFERARDGSEGTDRCDTVGECRSHRRTHGTDGSGGAVGFAGKVKTTAQMAALQLLLLSLGMPAVAAVRTTGIWLLYAAAVLSCTSASAYFAVAMPLLSSRK